MARVTSRTVFLINHRNGNLNNLFVIDLGTFVRVVDAVKGPYYPESPPFPTFTGEIGTEEIPMPAGTTDPGKLIEPVDPY